MWWVDERHDWRPNISITLSLQHDIETYCYDPLKHETSFFIRTFDKVWSSATLLKQYVYCHRYSVYLYRMMWIWFLLNWRVIGLRFLRTFDEGTVECAPVCTLELVNNSFIEWTCLNVQYVLVYLCDGSGTFPKYVHVLGLRSRSDQSDL